MAIYVESGYVESGYVERDVTSDNLQTIICKIDNINIKAVLNNEFPIPKIDVNQDISNNGYLDYSNLIGNEISNSLILDWIDYDTVEKIKNLDYNIEHILYKCDNSTLFNINIISVEYEEIYRGALWYNVKINYKRIRNG